MTLLDVAKAYINLYARTGDEQWLDEAQKCINEHKMELLGDFLDSESA